MPPINFQVELFNDTAMEIMGNIELSILRFNPISQDQLSSLLEELIKYCSTQYSSESNENIRTKAIEIYSQYLQYLVHYTLKHCAEPTQYPYVYNLTETLIHEPYFFHTIWVAANGSTILESLCKYNLENQIRSVLFLSAELHGGRRSTGHIKYISLVNQAGFSPLHSAVHKGEVKIVKLLLKEFYYAYAGDKQELIKVICQLNYMSASLLNTAAYLGHKDIAALLLDMVAYLYDGITTTGYRTYISIANKNRITPFHAACTWGNPTLVRFLLKRATLAFGGTEPYGINEFISHKDKNGSSPLHAVSKQNNRLNILQILLDKAEKIRGRNTPAFTEFLESKDILGRTPLHEACINNRKGNARLLLLYGANPDINDRVLRSARMDAPVEWDIFPPTRHTIRIVSEMEYRNPVQTSDQTIQSLSQTSIEPHQAPSYFPMVPFLLNPFSPWLSFYQSLSMVASPLFSPQQSASGQLQDAPMQNTNAMPPFPMSAQQAQFMRQTNLSFSLPISFFGDINQTNTSNIVPIDEVALLETAHSGVAHSEDGHSTPAHSEATHSEEGHSAPAHSGATLSPQRCTY